MKPNPFAQAIELFIQHLKETEDPRSPFYLEILKAAAHLRYHDGADEQSADSAKALQSYIEHLDVEQTRRGKTRWLGRKLQPLIDGLLQFTSALDTMIQAGPAPAMLIYGSAKLVLQLAQGFAECFEMVVDAMRETGIMLECYHIFSKTYDSSDEMRTTLVESYKNVLIFWQKAAKLFTRNGVKTFFRGIVKPFDSEWRTLRGRLEGDVRHVAFCAQALEGSAGKRREAEAKQREQHTDKTILQERRARMLVWLSGFDETAQIDYRTDLERFQKARHIGTCEWIFHDAEYQKWLTSRENEKMWLHANPGTGKSVLCSTIIQRLKDEGKKVVFFFCSFQDPLKKRIACALKSLALQLFNLHDDPPTDLERIYEHEVFRCGQVKLQNPAVIVMVLQSLLKTLDRVHVILDGLDECENREATLELLSICFQTSSLGIVKWLWTSRIEPDFQRLSALGKGRYIHIQKDQVEIDIKTCIEDSPELAGSSHQSVADWVAASDGNFLWLTLMLRTLTGCDLTCPAEVEEELGKFPKGLTQCYQRVLEHLRKRSKSQQQLARRLFLLVAFAEQPLTLCEVLDALSVREDSGGLSPNRKPFESLVKQLCCPLILLDPSTKNGRHDLVLRYFHKSTRDFFLQDPTSLDISGGSEIFFATPAQGQLSMSKLCMKYLLDERYRSPRAIDPTSDSFVDDHCFMRYAALFWHRHFAHAGYSDYLFDMVNGFMRSPNFWSCIRVQARVAPYLFGRLVGMNNGRFAMINPQAVGSDVGDYFASPLPEWLEDHERGSRLLQGYFALIQEWNPVLLQAPQAVLHCHPGVLGSQNIFSTESIESPDDSVFEMQFWTGSTQQSNCEDSEPLRMVIGNLPTKAGLRLFSFEGRQEHDSTPALLKQWHINLNAGCAREDLGFKHKRTWDVKASNNQPVLQLRSDEKIHEPATWSFDAERLSLSVHREGGDAVFNSPSETRKSWFTFCQNLSSSNKRVSQILQRQLHDRHRTIFTITWKVGLQNGGSETDDNSFDDSDSDVSSDDSESKRSIFTSDSEGRSLREDESSFGLVIVIDGLKDPAWFIWDSTPERTPDFRPSCNLDGSVVVWPVGKSTVMYADNLRQKSRKIPMPDLEGTRTGHIVWRELHFSTCGTVLYCLTVTVQAEEDTHHAVYRISLHNLRLTTTNSDTVTLTSVSPDLTFSTTTYETRIVSGVATVLTSWSADWVCLAINSPSSLCTVKLLRLPLSVTVSPDRTTIQTPSLPFYVPASFPARSPAFAVVRTSSEDHISFILQSPTTKPTAPPGPGPASDSHLSCPPTEKAESTPPVSTLPPVLITHPISRLGGWQAWDLDRDGKEPGLDISDAQANNIKGDYAAADQRFSVPIRSGLNWRKAITVSCW